MKFRATRGGVPALLFLVPILMGGQCTFPVEVTSPLPVGGGADERLAGSWYLVGDDGPVFETLLIQEGGQENFEIIYSALYWNMESAKGIVLAEATASNIEGVPFYSVRRFQQHEVGADDWAVFDWTGAEIEPGYIIVIPRIDDQDRLHLSFMDPDAVMRLAEQGSITGQLVEGYRYHDTGEWVAFSEREEGRDGMTVDYYLINASQDELATLIHDVPLDELFSLEAGPYYRADTSAETGHSPWLRLGP